MSNLQPDLPSAAPFTRRQFLVSLAALGGAAALRLPVASQWLCCAYTPGLITCAEGPTANGAFFLDRDNWKRHGMAHLVNVFWPGDNGALAFEGDASPFDGRLPQVSPGDDPLDSTPGAYAACAVNAFFDPFYAFETQGGAFAVVANLDWWSRRLNCGSTYYFHEAGWAQQIRATHGVETGAIDLLVTAWEGAWLLTIATALGAVHNYRVTNDLGWPGPADHYYHGTAEGSYPNDSWLRPATATTDGNLP